MVMTISNVIIARIKWADVCKKRKSTQYWNILVFKINLFLIPTPPAFNLIYTISIPMLLRTDRSFFDQHLPNFCSICFFQRTRSCTTSFHFHAGAHLQSGPLSFSTLLFAPEHWPIRAQAPMSSTFMLSLINGSPSRRFEDLSRNVSPSSLPAYRGATLYVGFSLEDLHCPLTFLNSTHSCVHNHLIKLTSITQFE